MAGAGLECVQGVVSIAEGLNRSSCSGGMVSCI